MHGHSFGADKTCGYDRSGGIIMHIWHRGEEYLLCYRGRVLFRIPRFIGRWLKGDK